MKFNLKTLTISFGLLVSIILPSTIPNLALAQGWKNQAGLETVGEKSFGTTTPTDVRIVIANIIKILLSLMGVFFVIKVVISGFEYMNSAGEAAKIKSSIERIKNAIIGLLIVLSAYGITEFITSAALTAVKK